MREEKEIKDLYHKGEERIEDELPDEKPPEKESRRETSGERYFGKKKWGLLACLTLIFVITGLGFKLMPGLMDHNKILAVGPSLNRDDIKLTEEMLEPFFIPPSQDSSKGAVRIDLSVVWSGLASIRFEKIRLKIRNDLYCFFSEAANEAEDLDPRVSYLEQEIGKLFQESLGVTDLAIKIKEIKYL